MSYAQMQLELDHYVHYGNYVWHRVKAPVIPSEKTYPARKMSPGEARERLAELDLRVNQSPAARLELLNAIGRVPVDPRPLELLGVDASMQGDEQMMRERWLAALDAGSQNPAVFWALARLEGVGLYENFDLYFRLPEDRAQLLRRLLKRTLANAPEHAEAYELSAWVEAFAAQPDIAAINLVQERFGSLPHQARTLLALALVRYRLGDAAGALHLIGEMGKLHPDRFLAAHIETLRAKLENRPPRFMAFEPGPAPTVLSGPRLELPDPHR